MYTVPGDSVGAEGLQHPERLLVDWVRYAWPRLPVIGMAAIESTQIGSRPIGPILLPSSATQKGVEPNLHPLPTQNLSLSFPDLSDDIADATLCLSKAKPEAAGGLP